MISAGALRFIATAAARHAAACASLDAESATRDHDSALSRKDDYAADYAGRRIAQSRLPKQYEYRVILHAGHGTESLADCREFIQGAERDYKELVGLLEVVQAAGHIHYVVVIW
jgi:hypothetical protein